MTTLITTADPAAPAPPPTQLARVREALAAARRRVQDARSRYQELGAPILAGRAALAREKRAAEGATTLEALVATQARIAELLAEEKTRGELLQASERLIERAEADVPRFLLEIQFLIAEARGRLMGIQRKERTVRQLEEDLAEMESRQRGRAQLERELAMERVALRAIVGDQMP